MVTRASEKGDEERRTMMDGKEEQGEARDADEQDKAGEMKAKGETVEAGKTDEEVKEKTLKGKKNFHISHSMLDCKYYDLPRGGGHIFNLKIWPPHMQLVYPYLFTHGVILHCLFVMHFLARFSLMRPPLF